MKMKNAHLITYLLLLLSIIAGVPLNSMEKPAKAITADSDKYLTLVEPALTQLRCSAGDDFIKKLGVERYTPLIIAVIMSDESEVWRLLSEPDHEKRGHLTNTSTANGHTALHFAVLMGDQALVTLLLDHGAPINEGPIGQTPYDFAARFPHIRALLIERGASYTYQMPDKIVNVLSQFINPKIIPSAIGVDCTELMEAVILNDEEQIRAILEKRPGEVNFPNMLGTTPLHCAALMGNLPLVQLLLAKHEPDVDLYDYSNTKGCTPLHFAALRRDLSVVHYLITHGADIEALAGGRQQPLDFAVQGSRLATAYLLLSHGARLHLAPDAIKKHAQIKDEIDRMRLRFGASFDSQRITALLQDPLERAAAVGNTQEVRRLLSTRPEVLRPGYMPRFIQNYIMRSSVNVPEQSPVPVPERLGRALSYAVCRYPEIVEILINAGAPLGEAQKIARAYKIRAAREYDERDEEEEDDEADKSYQLIADSMQRLSQAESSFLHNICPARSERLTSYLQLLAPEVLQSALAYRNGGPSLEQELRQEELADISSRLIYASEMVQKIDNPAVSNHKYHGGPLLWKLVMDGNLNHVKRLLELEAYPNPQNERGENLFDVLAGSGNDFLRERLQCIEQLLVTWMRLRPQLAESQTNLDFGLKLRVALLQEPAQALDSISTLLLRPRSLVINNQIQLVYNFLMQTPDMQSVIDPRSEYAPVIDMLLQRHPNLDFQLVRGLVLPSLEEGSRYISEVVSNVSAENIDQFYTLVMSTSDNALYENRAIIIRLLEKWPHKIVHQRLRWVCMKFEPRRLIKAVKKGDIENIIEALAFGANYNEATIDGHSLIEFIALHHSGDFNVLRNMINVLLDRGVDGNPIYAGESLMARLLTLPYQRFIERRAPVLIHLVDELERRGQQFTSLRMRLQGVLRSVLISGVF